MLYDCLGKGTRFGRARPTTPASSTLSKGPTMSLAHLNLSRDARLETAARLKCFPLALGLLLAAGMPYRSTAAVPSSQPDGAKLTVDGGTLRVQFWSPEIVRVTYAPGAELPELKSLSVVAKPESVKLTRRENNRDLTVSSAKIKVRIDKQTGAVTFLDSANHVLLQETAHGRAIAPATVAGAAVTSAEQSF